MSTTNGVQSLSIATGQMAIPVEPIYPELKPERVQEMLAAAPSWQLADGAATLHREKKFPDAMAAMLYSTYVRSLASSLRVPASVRLLGSRVLVTLGSKRKDRNPLSEAQLGLAVMIS
jgi:pterin-4a-carbinolamine dehydratase